MDALLEILKDGAFHSGDAIGARLGVSRAAVWKQVKRLQELGLALDSVKGRGYRLSPGTELLDRDQILSAMVQPPSGLQLELLSSVDSTNQYLLSRAGAGVGYFCLAEHQSAGRGRRGRAWCSPFGANLYLSTVWSFSQGAAALEGLSLAVGLAVMRAINRQVSAPLQLKWPNDLLWGERKVAGILLEISGDPAGECRVIIGVGVNLRLTDAQRQSVSQPCADLAEVAARPVEKNRLAGALIEELLAMLEVFEVSGFSSFAQEWSRYDAFNGHDVSVQMGADQWVSGVCRGVDLHGALRVETPDGVISYRGGEVSLRRGRRDC
ncbi:bifunctional biotin--[acetyl-CoA-carboxylase] ligase/biotin operon repressor BirA [Aestuariirhabdus sp. LZHN29]|uniref:bifunctional biotin--[acetyl-CoA-carboxylase] ligase/biotin operon repressor BirA n=1 Tax=Aestuariirhabdus sp. LZHN29 TaxID=3417462 RepID=UPI003CE6FF5D